MSRQHRKQGIWPGNDLARIIWPLVGALEDIVDLFEVSKRAETDETTLALMKKALVELCSFDDLVSDLRRVIRTSSTEDLPEHPRSEILRGLREYDLAVQPSRELLRDIRNTIGAHRTGIPSAREEARFSEDFRAWGAWEQHLVELEAQCTRERWVGVINAGIALRNVVVDKGMGHWYSTTGDTIRLFIPIRLS